jgi:hypothetical protein
VSYTGGRPFTGEAVTTLEGRPPPQWNSWLATENWSALVDDRGWGLGVWNPDCLQVKGGFNAKPGAGGPRDNPCGYLAPLRDEVLDHDITHDYRYELVLGTVEEIRARVYRQPRPGLPAWTFASDRQGWRYQHATDTGWPIRGELVVMLDKDDPALLAPRFVVQAEAAPVLVIEAAFAETNGEPQVFWSTLEEPATSAGRSVRFAAVTDGAFREYRVRLADSAAYRGMITGLRIDPADGGGGTVRVRGARFAAE